MQLLEFQEGIVDSAVIFHNELNTKLWRNGQLDSTVRYKLMLIAEHFIKFVDLPNIRLRDITISGSNAGYTYTTNSDLDLHLVVDVPRAAEFHLKPLFDAKKNQYNFQHDIKIHDVDVELYIQPSTDAHHSSGIYSVLDDKWLVKPKPVKATISDDDVEFKVNNYVNKIKLALKSKNLKTALKVKEELSKLRKNGLEREGEFSVENIAFKVLRVKGWINRLRQHVYDLEDERLSLENRYETK